MESVWISWREREEEIERCFQVLSLVTITRMAKVGGSERRLLILTVLCFVGQALSTFSTVLPALQNTTLLELLHHALGQIREHSCSSGRA